MGRSKVFSTSYELTEFLNSNCIEEIISEKNRKNIDGGIDA